MPYNWVLKEFTYHINYAQIPVDAKLCSSGLESNFAVYKKGPQVAKSFVKFTPFPKYPEAKKL